ncbi:hypothetical protein [Psychrobacter sp. I-STPA6b]|uniref:hypothetical protein n=1 Tax=Psychrobacter sp. I-STPA6b TaxID=2585718 RepID=UPI001D0CCDC6|nr:hypothetical protein [Psychrobacter sp. I-STPA6b]
MIQLLTKTRSNRPLLGICGALLFMTLSVSGCSDPMKQSIPTSSDKWQDKLGDTFEELSEEDRQLLSRYMLRMKLSGAYESGAMPRITIGDALKQQREYERLHPDNPTGKKSPIDSASQTSGYAQTYPITLLPIQSSSEDGLNNVQVRFLLSNKGAYAIDAFEGTLMIKADAFKQGKAIHVSPTNFDPAIAPNTAGKIIVDSSIEDLNIMRAIKNPQSVNVEIIEGTIHLVGAEPVTITQTLN